jgi:hypothetical protein
MKNISKLLLTLFTVLISVAVQAQPVEMADTMRSEGKIYVVVGIVLIVLTGLIAYLFMLDRRVKKLENGQK